MGKVPSISERSGRVVKNTILLYVRMLLLMLIGLFTSRVVLQALGVDDYGIYNAVGGVVGFFTFITGAISTAISRYMAFELGRGDVSRLKRVFSTSVIIQLFMAVFIVILVETAGLWFLHHRMVIPSGRMDAAEWVLHCSTGVLVFSLLSVPYNATIIAHEKMGAFAAISILEAILKLSVAVALYFSPIDNLELYAVLMLAVSAAVRFCYAWFCRRRFEEPRGRLVWDGALLKEMGGFSGWSFFGSSAYVLNTQGINIASNVFFGVGVNAARGIASQVENIVKQFVSNFLLALNPQITKSYASKDESYTRELICKGTKFSSLVILFFALPFFFESDGLLRIWLGNVPEGASLFTRLVIICLFSDMMFNPLLQLIISTGRVRGYYISTGLVSYLGLPVAVLLFKTGFPAWTAYLVFFFIYLTVDVLRLVFAKRLAGFPVAEFLKESVLKILEVALPAAVLAGAVHFIFPEGLWRMLAVVVVSTLSIMVFTYLFALTGGERDFIFRKTNRYLPDRLFLKIVFKKKMGYRLHLDRPETFNERIQWMKVHDHNPLYHTLADKAAVKDYVRSVVGEEYVIPTLGIWDRPEEIDFDSLPDRFVLKCTHDSGSTIICRDKASFDRKSAMEKLGASLAVDFYKLGREWAYKGLKPRVIAEEYIGDDIPDYKFFCSNGRPAFLFIARDRNSGEETKFDFYDMDFNHLDVRNGHPCSREIFPKPEKFEQMKALAAELSAGLPLVRVDLYESEGKLYFGEYTFYHWGGFVPFEPEKWDYEFAEWLK